VFYEPICVRFKGERSEFSCVFLTMRVIGYGSFSDKN